MRPRISTTALWRSARRLLSLVGLAALLAFGTGAAIMVQAGRSDLQSADAAIVVLDEGAGASQRLDRVRQLYTDGRVSRILLAGGDATTSRAALLERGVREDAVVALDGATAQAQLVAAQQTLAQDRLTTTLLIAEPVATLRLLKIAHDVGIRPLSWPVGADDIDPADVVRETGRYFRYVLLGQ
jgi:hypothetical protein